MTDFIRRLSGLFVPPEPRIHRPQHCDMLGFGAMMMAGGITPTRTVFIKGWGAGGGNRITSPAASGGAGGYADVTVTLLTGTVLTCIAGGPGTNGDAGGGGGLSGCFLGSYPASFTLSNALLVIGSGGGASGGRGGGAGGGLTGGSFGAPGGTGGTQSAGGDFGGGLFTGGSGTGTDAAAGGWPGGGTGRVIVGVVANGGGGSGYYGGGAGNQTTAPNEAPGGGGSSYAPGGTTIGGSGTTPGNASDPDRAGAGEPNVGGRITIYVNGILAFTSSINGTPESFTIS